MDLVLVTVGVQGRVDSGHSDLELSSDSFVLQLMVPFGKYPTRYTGGVRSPHHE
jgi:hypothetical protein